MRRPQLSPIRSTAARSALARLALGAALAGALVAVPARAAEYDEVSRLLNAGQPAAALERAERHIQANPRDPQMRFIKAVILSRQGRDPQAEELLTALTRDYPELAEPWNNLAVIYASRGELEHAQEALESALRINPRYAVALENLGDVRLRQALQAYEQARKLDGENPRLGPRIDGLRVLLPAAPASAPVKP